MKKKIIVKRLLATLLGIVFLFAQVGILSVFAVDGPRVVTLTNGVGNNDPQPDELIPDITFSVVKFEGNALPGSGETVIGYLDVGETQWIKLTWVTNHSVVWESNFLIRYVYTKGGSDGNMTLYDPSAIMSSSPVSTPINKGGNLPDVSHVSFYFLPDEVLPQPVFSFSVSKQILEEPLTEAMTASVPSFQYDLFRKDGTEWIPVGTNPHTFSAIAPSVQTGLPAGTYRIREIENAEDAYLFSGIGSNANLQLSGPDSSGYFEFVLDQTLALNSDESTLVLTIVNARNIVVTQPFSITVEKAMSEESAVFPAGDTFTFLLERSAIVDDLDTWVPIGTAGGNELAGPAYQVTFNNMASANDQPAAYRIKEINLGTGYTLASVTVSNEVEPLVAGDGGYYYFSTGAPYPDGITVTLANTYAPEDEDENGDNPPEDNPPTDNPPTDNPPTDSPPTDNPPTDAPPTDNPTADNPPTNNPPEAAPVSEATVVLPEPVVPLSSASLPIEETVAVEEDMEPELIPESAPVVEILLADEVPLDAPELPKTAGLPLLMILGAGTASVLTGIGLRKRK